MWVAVVIWEVRRLRCGGGNNLLRSTKGGWLMCDGGGCGCRWRAGRCGRWAVEWRRRQCVEKHGGRWDAEWVRRTWVFAAG